MAIENAKILNVRIKNKYDSYENWAASGLILEAGEIAIAHTTVDVKVDNGTAKHPALLMKVGDGEKTFANLPWMSAKAADVLAVCKDENELKTFVNGVIANAGIATSTAMEALAGRVTTAEGEIDALQADLNTAETGLKARVTTAEGAIDALEALVGEKNVATQINEAIAALNLANTYEAKGEAAKVQTALDTYKTSNDAAVQANANAADANTKAIAAIKDGTTIDSFADVETALAGKETAGAAATAEANAKAYADGLAGNYDAKGAAATAESNAKAYAKEYADGLAGNYDAAGSAAQALTDAKDYTDGEIAEWVGEKNVATQISEAIANEKLADTYAAKVHAHVKADITDFAHNHEMSEVNGLADALAGKQEVGDYATKAEAQGYADAKDEAIAAAKKAGDDAQADVDALETYVGTIPEGATATNIVAYVQEKTSGIATDAALSELTNRVGAAEGAIDAIEADYLKAADKTELQDQIDVLDGLVGDTSVADQIAAEAAIARAAEKANADAIAAIEEDYLKAADKTELQNQINTIMNNPDTEGVINSINEFTQYIAEHGEVAEGFRTDIDANADAIAAIEEDYLKAADKTALQEQITANDGEIAALQTAVGTKAAQADLEALEGRVATVEGDLNAENTGLKARMTAAEGDIDALETKVGDKSVADQIDAAIEALKIGDYAKAADLAAAIERIAKNEGDIVGLDTRLGTAEGKISTLETEVAKKANDADLAAIAKTGSTDDLVQGELVLVFDCGTSAV